jgi:magnesium transporter
MDVNELVRAVRARVPLDAAEMLARESPAVVEQVLAALPADFAALVSDHLAHARGIPPKYSAPGLIGELMEPVRGAQPPQATAGDAIAFLRSAEHVGDITYIYIVDDAGKLTGLVVFRDLLLARPEQRLDSIMLRTPFSLAPETPVGDAVKAVVKRHYPVYPVCDGAGQLVGVVRGWRLFEQQAIEVTAQSGQMVGVDKEERVTTGILPAFRLRHPWLQLNLLTVFFAGFVVSLFSDTIAKAVVLAAFLPVLMGQCGNTGYQALALTLRGMTLGDLERHSLRRLLVKEILLGALNGLLTGVVAGAAMWWSAARDQNPQAPLLALVIVLSMTAACTVSGLFGVLVPAGLKRAGADPVTASAIFLTTITDVASMGLMLTLASVMVL